MNRRTELRIVRPLVPPAPREEIDDSIEQLVADRRGELPNRAPLDYVELPERSPVDLVSKILIVSILALGIIALAIGIIALAIGFSAGGRFG